MILVTGATGYVGGAALRRLMAMGEPVSAMARDGERAARALPAGIPIRVADYGDPASLARSLEGIARLLFVASDGDGREVMRHHANVITAIAASAVEHVVFTSIVDLDEASPFYFTPVYRDAERRMARLRASVTLLRCGLYSDFLLQHWVGPALNTGRVSLPLGDARIASVSRLDVAEAAAAAVASPEHRGKSYDLTGPAAHSFDEIARIAAAAAGVPVRYEPGSSSDYLAEAWETLSDPWPHAFTTLCASISQGRYEAVSRDLGALLGRPAERLEDFFRRATAGNP